MRLYTVLVGSPELVNKQCISPRYLSMHPKNISLVDLREEVVAHEVFRQLFGVGQALET